VLCGAPGDVEVVRMRENRRITIRGHGAEKHSRPSRNGNSVPYNVVGIKTWCEGNGRSPPQPLFGGPAAFLG
jgi:hypothetical protein